MHDIKELEYWNIDSKVNEFVTDKSENDSSEVETKKLQDEKKKLTDNYKTEKRMNILMEKLYKQCDEKDLYVMKLTKMDGNCLFSSLNCHGIGCTTDELRSAIANVLYIFKSYKYFFPNVELTLEEMFKNSNEIEYVYTYQNRCKVFSKYSYEIMCQDLTNDGSWSKYPAQIVLLIISFLFKVKIIIIGSNSSYENVIDAWDNLNCAFDVETIYLGHLSEAHYLPLEKKNDVHHDKLFYDDAKNELYQWREKNHNYKIDFPEYSKIEIPSGYLNYI